MSAARLMLLTAALTGLSAALTGAADVKSENAAAAHEAAEDRAKTVPGGASKGVKACHADIERFCAKIKPGEGRIGRCLQSRIKKLSKSCRRFALHGGKAHVMESLAEIDKALTPASP